MHAAALAAALLAANAATTQPAPAPPAPPAAAPAPVTGERAALGRRLAELGEFNAVTSAMGRAEVEAMARETPDLSDAERARLRVVGAQVLAAGRARILARVGDAYAREFTLQQLRAIVRFLASPAGRAYVGALPRVLPAIAAAMQGVDLHRDVRAQFCRETGKLCGAE
jgi:hypothetical protein